MKLLSVGTLAVLIWLQVPLVAAQLGRDCSDTKACMPHQSCYFGYCTCDRGYVRNDRNCFPARKYGETCFYDVQCVDHRMTCHFDNSSLPPVQLCLCDKFHEWSEEQGECVQALNITEILSKLEETNTKESIEKEAKSVFVWIVVAGLGVAALLAIFAITLIVYGCCLYECYDRCTKNYPDIEGRPCPPECHRYQRTT